MVSVLDIELLNLELNKSQLGKKSQYKDTYDSSLLFAVPRISKRQEIGIFNENLPFVGYDLWNHYEVSWLNSKGKPVVAVAEIYYNCESEYIIESKSLKLYFNSLNNTKYSNTTEVENIIKKDLSACVGLDVVVKLYDLNNLNKLENNNVIYNLNQDNQDKLICLDHLDIECDVYTVNRNYLDLDSDSDSDSGSGSDFVTESLYSNLLKSNCLVTGQPDWGSVVINYTGKKIDHQKLLKYLISFRNHNEFHEQCVERIFIDILNKCKPKELTVYARYTRRGGLDINPYRTNKINSKLSQINIENFRLVRQ